MQSRMLAVLAVALWPCALFADGEEAGEAAAGEVEASDGTEPASLFSQPPAEETAPPNLPGIRKIGTSDRKWQRLCDEPDWAGHPNCAHLGTDARRLPGRLR